MSGVRYASVQEGISEKRWVPLLGGRGGYHEGSCPPEVYSQAARCLKLPNIQCLLLNLFRVWGSGFVESLLGLGSVFHDSGLYFRA